MILANLIPDFRGLFSDLEVPDLLPLIFASFWIVALIASLRGVDRRDEIAHVTYVCTLLAIGVVLFFGLPFGKPRLYSETSKLILFVALIIVPSLRWMLERKRTLVDEAFAKAQSGSKAKE